MSTAFGLSATNKFIPFILRAFFFSLNLAFNALMWTLFTMALTRATSTTRVSLINTSFNFLLTALSGWVVFGEKLPALWWVGAMGLVVGNVVIGRRDEGISKENVKERGIGLGEASGADEGNNYRDEDGEIHADLGYVDEDESNVGRTHG